MTGIRKEYPGVLAVDDVDLDLVSGEIHALAGENGSGKSTLAKMLYGAVTPDRGRLAVDGVEVPFGRPREALKRGIVAITQELTLAPQLSVAENVLMGRLPRTRLGLIDWPVARRRAIEPLERLEVKVDPRRCVGELTIALQQEIEVARAIASEPRVLVLDEATSSLSDTAAEHLLRELEALRRAGVAILFISHRLRELYTVARQVTVLRDGVRVGVFALSETPEAELVRRMVGRPLEDLYGKRRIPHGEKLLSVRNLTTSDGSVNRVSFDIHRGEIVGVAGLVGCGKSELGQALAGAYGWDGEVELNGRRVQLRTPRAALAAKIAYVPEDRKEAGLLPGRSIVQNLSLAWMPQLTRWGFLDVRAERRMASEAVGRFRVRTRSLDVPVAQLSGGNQQKVILARCAALSPELIVLAEPTRGVDVGAKVEVYGLIQDLATRGAGVLMISSELPELLGLADRILVMFAGELRGEFDAASTGEEELAHVALTGGLPQPRRDSVSAT